MRLYNSFPLQVQLEDDMIVAKHLTTLYSNMLEHNLCRYFDFLGVIILIYWNASSHLDFARIIEPYSKVQVDYVASKIGLPKPEVL